MNRKKQFWFEKDNQKPFSKQHFLCNFTQTMSDNHNIKKRKLEDNEINESEPPRKKLKTSGEDGENKDEMEMISKKEIMKKLNEIFDKIEQAADLTVGGKSNSLPLIPGLYVKNIGEIPLPICSEQLNKLLLKATKSSYGNGLKTGNDESVRKSHELTADQFHFNNPEWNKKIKSIFEYIAIKLGCCPENVKYVHGYPYKLLIYQKDGHFIQHRDTQKADGMFATLIIQLPSKYKVIDNKPILTVKHKDDVYNYYFGTNKTDCEYNIYYAAHYCDLVHKINRIKSGVRISITYNICWEGQII